NSVGPDEFSEKLLTLPSILVRNKGVSGTGISTGMSRLILFTDGGSALNPRLASSSPRSGIVSFADPVIDLVFGSTSTETSCSPHPVESLRLTVKSEGVKSCEEF